MSSFGLAAAAQHGTSSGSSSRSNRNSTILPSTGTTSDAYPSLYKRIGSTENLHTNHHHNDNTSSSSSSGPYHHQNHHNPHHSSSINEQTSRSSQQSSQKPSQIINNIRMSSSLTIQHDPNSSVSNQLSKTPASSMASSQPAISHKNNSSSPASSSGSSTQYYQHMINNHAQNGSDLIAIKCKFESEFRRFSLHRSDIKSLEEFQKTIEHFHKLFNISFSLFYIDPIHGDLLPISNDINFKLAISSAKPLLRLVVQRKGNQMGCYPYGTKKSNFLGTLLPSSGSSASNKLARLQISAPEDFRQVSSIIDVDIVPETCRRVRLVKHGSDKPLGFYIRDGTSVRVTTHGVEKVPGIFISRLIPGGLAESTGLLAVNDEVLEVNGIEVSGKSLDQVTDMMVANSSNLIITIRPANQRGHGTLSGSYSSNTLGSQHSNFMTGSLERSNRPKKLSQTSGMDYHNAHYHHGSGRHQNFYPEDTIRRNASHRHSANIIQSSVQPAHQQYSSTSSRIHSRQHPSVNSTNSSQNRHSVHIGAVDDHSVIISGHQRPSVDDDSDDDEDEIHDHFATSSVRHNGHYGSTTVTINSMPPPVAPHQSQQQQQQQQQSQQGQFARTPSNHSISNNSQQAAAAAGNFVRNSLRGKNRPESSGLPSGFENVTYSSRSQPQQLHQSQNPQQQQQLHQQQQQQQQNQQQQQQQHYQHQQNAQNQQSMHHSQQQQQQQYNIQSDKSSNIAGLYLTPASSTSSSPIAKNKLTSTSILVNQSSSNSSASSTRKQSEPNENDIVTL